MIVFNYTYIVHDNAEYMYNSQNAIHMYISL